MFSNRKHFKRSKILNCPCINRSFGIFWSRVSLSKPSLRFQKKKSTSMIPTHTHNPTNTLRVYNILYSKECVSEKATFKTTDSLLPSFFSFRLCLLPSQKSKRADRAIQPDRMERVETRHARILRKGDASIQPRCRYRIPRVHARRMWILGRKMNWIFSTKIHFGRKIKFLKTNNRVVSLASRVFQFRSAIRRYRRTTNPSRQPGRGSRCRNSRTRP